LPVHTPTLEVREADILNAPPSDPASVLPKGFQPKLKKSRTWLLTGHRVTFERSGGGQKASVRGVKNATKVSKPTGKLWHDLKWVPDLEKVRGAGNGRIRQSAVLGSDPLLSSQLALTAGRLEGRRPTISGFAKVKCAFVSLNPSGKVPMPKEQQFLTDHVVFITGPAKAFAIVLTPVAGGIPKRIVLKPKATPIKVEVCNENTTGAVKQNDTTHFAVFYDLIDRNLAPADRLTPQPTGVVERRPQDPPAFCPPAFLFNS
jgi:hypothetical protein